MYIHIVWNKLCFSVSLITVNRAHETLKVALQILDEKFTKILKKSYLHSQSLLIFIHKNPVVKNHPTTRKNRDLLWPRSTPTGTTVYFYMSSSLIYILEYTDEALNIASDEYIIENNYMFVMLSSLSVISHLIFPQKLFLFLAQNLRIT